MVRKIDKLLLNDGWLPPPTPPSTLPLPNFRVKAVGLTWKLYSCTDTLRMTYQSMYGLKTSHLSEATNVHYNGILTAHKLPYDVRYEKTKTGNKLAPNWRLMLKSLFVI